MYSKTTINEAALAGLALAVLPVAFVYVSNTVPSTALTLLLWTVKLLGCIWLMKFFIERHADGLEGGPDYGECCRFGLLVSVFSALVYSAAYLFLVKYVIAEEFAEVVEKTVAQMSASLSAAEKETLDSLLPRLPSIAFWSNLIWCILYGTALSSILSKFIIRNR